MTIKEFMDSSDFGADELYFEVNYDGRTFFNLAEQDLYFYYNSEIKHFDFVTGGDNSGESYLTIRFYV